MAGIKAPILDIKNLLVNSGLFQYVAIWNNQIKYENAGQTYDFPKPAAFIEVIPAPVWGELALGLKAADLGFKIHIAHEQLDSGTGTFEENLEVFELRDATLIALCLQKPTGCGPLVQVGEHLDTDHTQIYHYMIDFVCHFVDTMGSKIEPKNPDHLIESGSPLPVVPTLTYNIPQ